MEPFRFALVLTWWAVTMIEANRSLLPKAVETPGPSFGSVPDPPFHRLSDSPSFSQTQGEAGSMKTNVDRSCANKSRQIQMLTTVPNARLRSGGSTADR
jgi:hypothetical protein